MSTIASTIPDTATPAPFAHHEAPRVPLICYVLGRAALALTGWQVRGEVPAQTPRAVVIAAPHTSNWDLPLMLAGSWVLRFRVHWLGKASLFRGPLLGGLMRAIGGIPVDRSAAHGLVEQVAQRLRAADRLYIAVPPSGTRGSVSHWKSGFYHIARSANVPIILGFIDYERKVCGLGPAILPTGDVTADMDRIRAFYAGIVPLYPEQVQTPRLREEDAADDTRGDDDGDDDAAVP